MINKMRMIKTASGTVLRNTSPQGIEQFLVSDMQEALGEFKDAVKIKPYLQIDKEDQDLSGNVSNAFGAIELNVYGTKLYIPFIIADKTLLPFDTIRLGGEETAYDYSKLRKLVNAIEHKAKSQNDDDSGNPFQTMEVADFKDIQPNNGFLGNIMAVRDMARQRDSRGDYPWSGSEFGVVSDERLQRQASTVDVFDSFHEVMEKIAEVKVFTEEQIDEYEQHIRKQAYTEELEGLEKTAAAPTMEEARIRRDMTQLSNEKLVDVRRAASGNDISFPTFFDGRLEYISGRVYTNFRSWFENEKNYTSGKLDGFVLDVRGNYKLLKGNDPFMMSIRQPGAFKLPTERIKSMKEGELYLIEDSPTTAFHPFVVRGSYLQDQLNDGMVVSVREESLHPHQIPSRTNNTLFLDRFRCAEVIPGKENGNGGFSSPFSREFHIVISKDPNITKPTFMNDKEMKEYITQNAKDMVDAKLATQVVTWYEDNNILMPADHEVFITKKQIEGYYTRPDGLTKTGPMAKEASFDQVNKARLVVTNDRQPKSYSIQWQYADPADAGGVSAKRLQRHNVDNLSMDSAKNMLNRLGYDYRTTAQFFEITDRNGRSATFALPDIEKASQVAPEKAADEKANKKMNGLAQNMLHSQNFLPHLANTVGDGLSIMLAAAVPGSVPAANKMSNAFGFGKSSSFETAQAIEKVASKINGQEWHEISALLNLKYRLDKLAGEISEGKYLYNAEPVFEKVAELRPMIAKKASDLIDFNRKQLLRTSSYIVEPNLVKQAVHQLDELAAYAGDVKKNETLSKEAGIFRAGSELSEASKKVSQLEGNMKKLQNNFSTSQAKMRAKMSPNYKGDKLGDTIQRADEAEKAYKDGSSELQSAMKEKGDAKHKESKKNMMIAAGFGVPGLAGLGYAAQSERNKKKD